jgi:hypothetical protein
MLLVTEALRYLREISEEERNTRSVAGRYVYRQLRLLLLTPEALSCSCMRP